MTASPQSHHLNLTPVLSPRSAMSLSFLEIQNLKTNLIINIDKETLALLKTEFQLHNNKMNKQTFIRCCMQILNLWQKDLRWRQSRMVVYLMQLFEEIEDKVDAEITWQKFNNLIIEKALNLKSLQSYGNESIIQFKPAQWAKPKPKTPTPIQKILAISKHKKLAYLCQQSNRIEFLSSNSNSHNYKPLILDRQDLTVEKSLIKRIKNTATGTTIKQNYKKQVIVSSYNVTFLDMIYVSNDRYQILLTSSTDGYVRGWDINGNIPVLAKQFENEEEKIAHQFPVQIHTMSWDDINDVLYCSSKSNKIYVWILKTDLQKQLIDFEGHNSMISSMLMIPKLQFLATGDYEGKLMLWDTISLQKKYKYQEHTRSIVSMTFHQTSILLFTSSFDHSICVWNPYIPTLIYKIVCNINVIQVQIIPNSNYLACLDLGSNLKIREIKKFQVVGGFVVDRPDDNDLKSVDKGNYVGDDAYKIQPSTMAICDNPTRFFFAGNSFKSLDFIENQSLTTSQFYPSILKYNPQTYRLYVCIKNTILIWDILTGHLHNILQSQCEKQITCIDLIPNSSRFVIGDNSGNIFLRKLQNGIKISCLFTHKLKASASFLLVRKGGIWNQSIIIGVFMDGEIVVFGKDESYDYNLLRNFNIKKFYGNAVVFGIEYEEKRNILVVGTNNGEIVCMDVDKVRVINYIPTKNLQILSFSIKSQFPSFLTFGKSGEIFGVFLPPHSKKFKPFCNLQITTQANPKIACVAMSKQTDKCYLAYQNGSILQTTLKYKNTQKDTHKDKDTTQYIGQYDEVSRIFDDWEINLKELIKDMILIVDDKVLAVILFMKNISLISAENGVILNILPSYQGLETSIGVVDRPPLSYYHENCSQSNKSKCHQIYLTETKKYYRIDLENMECENLEIGNTKESCNKMNELRIFHDPYFLYEEYVKIVTNTQNSNKKGFKKKSNKGLQESEIKAEGENKEQGKDQSQQKFVNNRVSTQPRIVWNKQWRVFPEFKQSVNKKIKQICRILQKPAKNDESFNSSLNDSSKGQNILSKAKFTRKKSLHQFNQNSLNQSENIERALAVQKKWQLIKLEMQQQGQRKRNSKPVSIVDSKKQQKVYENLESETRYKRDSSRSILITKHKSLYKAESYPYIRLGMALMNINEQDQKAKRFIDMGNKKSIELPNNIKLPKISYKNKEKEKMKISK